MRKIDRLTISAAGASAVVVLTAAACGSSGSPAASNGTTSTTSGSATTASQPATTSTSSGGATTTTAAGANTTAAGATNVTATETEYHIALSKTSFVHGAYVFKAVNAGTTSHTLVINGPGVNNVTTPNIAPGESSSLSVTLQTGTYELYCRIDDHKTLGMDVHITVT